jgi:hypothetical protein
MTVREKLNSGVWVRAMHSPKVAASAIEAQEKVFSFHVIYATEKRRVARLTAKELTPEEYSDMATDLKRMMEESIEMAAQLEGVGMETVVEMMAQTYEQKQCDYGDSFSNTQRMYGMMAGAVRLHDKVARMRQLMMKKAAVADESLSDTVRDLGTYAAMIWCWMEGERGIEN